MDWMVRVPSKGSIAAGVSSVVNIVWAMGGRPGVGVADGCNGIGSLPQLSRNLKDGSWWWWSCPPVVDGDGFPNQRLSPQLLALLLWKGSSALTVNVLWLWWEVVGVVFVVNTDHNVTGSCHGTGDQETGQNQKLLHCRIFYLDGSSKL